MFKELIEEKLGITDLPTYREYKKKKVEAEITEEEIKQLSPDTIRSDEFWKWINESEFSKDGVSFDATKDVPIEQCNYMGNLIGVESGCLNYFNRICLTYPRNLTTKAKILEIGPGFGAFKNVVEAYPFLEYYGVDVYPKIEGVMATKDGDTQIPDEIMAQDFNLVYSSNVFQHLSQRQRDSYFSQIAKLISRGGIFSFNTITSKPGHKTGFMKDGRSYMCHYGQFVEVPTTEEIYTAIEKHFFIISYTVGPIPNQQTFHCIAKPPSILIP